ncbi:MAG TPA: DnaD domain protein [Candidatus Faecenecus gallistercoris]|uniref:DnaD domain protein n=1 Tax=Candidatus Faecenecus gallistercoris TaxID=2840793 RepID=A0A9D0Z0M2_9FIRM|nr:DnaD domain protein [Candidatus Faecenecus gallistercoris]
MQTILPADIYMVVNKTVITSTDRKIITMLYQPIIGHVATSLYFTLCDDLDKREVMSEELTHYHLMMTMQLKLESIVIAREKLEAIGLLKTFFKKENVNTYVYQLYSPLSAAEFLNHPILNVVLYNNLGKKEYQKVVSYFKIPRINLKDYQEITKQFDEVFTPVPGNSITENDDIADTNKNRPTLMHQIDFNLLISSIPESMISPNCFNNDVKELINNLSYTYGIDDLTMQGIVRDSLNERGLIDKNELRKNARNYYQFEQGGRLPTLIYTTQPEYLRSPTGDVSNWAKMVYTFETVTPYDYLKSKYKNGEPSARDLRLIESLLTDMKLKPGVVNVLIAYVLKINNQKLSKNYVETIAGQWKRLNIETVEDAMRLSEKEHKRVKKKLEANKKTKPVETKQKEAPVPDWFNKELDTVGISSEEQKELDDIIKNI